MISSYGISSARISSRAVYLWQLLQRRKHRADFRLSSAPRCPLPRHILVKLRVARGPSPQIVYAFRAIAKDSFSRWLANAVRCHPRAHKRVRGDLIRHHHIAAQIQRKSADIAGVAFIEVLMSSFLIATQVTGGHSKVAAREFRGCQALFVHVLMVLNCAERQCTPIDV
jgi:hypothetical protein